MFFEDKVCMHVCQLQLIHHRHQLLLNGTPILVVMKTKFLGIMLDSIAIKIKMLYKD